MKSKTLSRIAYGIISAGGIIVIGGIAYNDIVNKPSLHPNLKRYYQINGKLNSRLPDSVTLKNLESKTTELLAYRDKLKDERKKITRSPSFTEIKKNYNSDHQRHIETTIYTIVSGFAVMFLGLIPAYLRNKKENNESPIENI